MKNTQTALFCLSEERENSKFLEILISYLTTWFKSCHLSGNLMFYWSSDF